MATATVPYVTVEQYLHSSYEPDMDYVDGVLEERNLGEYDHADLQGELLTLLRVNAEQWQIRAVPEARVQVAPGRYRVPDVCVMPLAWTREPIIRQAPLLCLEVVSPEDRWPRVLQRCGDFLAMGVPEVWIFDPAARIAFRLTAEGLQEQPKDSTMRLAGSSVAIDLRGLFAVLDR